MIFFYKHYELLTTHRSILRKMRCIFLISVALVGLISSSTVMAKISPLCFKNITAQFKQGQEAYSPTMGIAALESGQRKGSPAY